MSFVSPDIEAVTGRTIGPSDPRNNYFTTGAFSGSVTNGIEVGTSQMSNTTMETYEQVPGMNCFACHARGSGTVNPNAVSGNPLSHIYTASKPLF